MGNFGHGNGSGNGNGQRHGQGSSARGREWERKRQRKWERPWGQWLDRGPPPSPRPTQEARYAGAAHRRWLAGSASCRSSSSRFWPRCRLAPAPTPHSTVASLPSTTSICARPSRRPRSTIGRAAALGVLRPGRPPNGGAADRDLAVSDRRHAGRRRRQLLHEPRASSRAASCAPSTRTSARRESSRAPARSPSSLSRTVLTPEERTSRRQPQDSRGAAGVPDHPEDLKEPDPGAVPERDLLRKSGVRDRGGLAGVLRQARPRPDPGRSRRCWRACRSPLAIYDPLRNPVAAKARQAYVLDQMVRNGFITERGPSTPSRPSSNYQPLKRDPGAPLGHVHPLADRGEVRHADAVPGRPQDLHDSWTTTSSVKMEEVAKSTTPQPGPARRQQHRHRR